MASIKGVTLKGIKTFIGREGYGMEANIYLDGKRVGRYFDAASGGEAYIELTDDAEREIQQRSDSFFAEYPYEYPDLESFLVILGDFIEREKEYKKSVKKGFTVMVAGELCHSSNGYCIFIKIAGAVDKQVVKAKYKDKIEKPCVYTSLADFDVL